MDFNLNPSAVEISQNKAHVSPVTHSRGRSEEIGGLQDGSTGFEFRGHSCVAISRPTMNPLVWAHQPVPRFDQSIWVPPLHYRGVLKYANLTSRYNQLWNPSFLSTNALTGKGQETKQSELGVIFGCADCLMMTHGFFLSRGL